MGMGVQDLSLPPGFRFFPTDEELLVQYLCRKVAGHSFSLQIIAEIDLYKHDPWILPSKAVFGEKEWYFFSPRDRKYPNGSRPNRVAGSGYWKATGTDKIITTEGRKIGIKKALVFYVGKAPKGTKTNWIMHEYRLLETSRKHNSSRLDEWVLCRVYKKGSASHHHHQKALLNSSLSNSNDQQSEFSCNSSNSTNSSSQFDDIIDTLTEIQDRSFALPRINSLKSFQDQKIVNNNNNNCYSQNLMSSCKLDWGNGLPTGMTEYATNGAHHGVGLGSECGNVYYPSVPPLEDEVESGIGPGSAGATQFYRADSLDPFGLRYVMTQQVPGGAW
ncbi:hypothetical protein Scep_011209 [Stephania cephalantha]|uniref:NAC domain-containing protein n=1 Tax=Stephania cephalantha TaxID=152367 RepID=A0AAP0P8P9_9MAGN